MSITKAQISAVLLLLGLFRAQAGPGTPLPLTYQGHLTDNAQPASGEFDIRFSIWDSASGGAELFAVTNRVAVSGGLFSSQIAFDGELPITQSTAWLGIGVRPAGSATPFAELTSAGNRQRLSFAPYSIRAVTADLAYATAAAAVGTSHLQDAAVTTAILAPEAVTTVQLATNAVTTEKIANGTIAATDVNAASFNTTFWRTSGNTGTTEGLHFLGTTDDRPLELRAGGSRVLRLEPNENLVGGQSINSIRPGVVSSVIAGGGALLGTFAQPYPNVVAGDYGFIGSGYANRLGTNFASVVVGGTQNTNLAQEAFIGGGRANRVDEPGTYAAIGGGWDNIASGTAATIPGGEHNEATGVLSLAAGRNAKASHRGAFVWADSQTGDFASTVDNQFRVRAAGGAEFVGGSTTEALKYSGSRSGAFDTPVGYAENNNTSGTSSPTLRLVGKGGNAVDGVLSVSSLGTGYLASFGNASAFVSRLSTNGTWTGLAFNSTSDRAAKEHFVPVDPRQILDKVSALPLARWSYKVAPGLDHIGPVAQDFHAAFGLNGADDKHIATVDADGIALAAIQGLNQKVEAEAASLRAENDHLRRQNLQLLRRLEALEARFE